MKNGGKFLSIAAIVVQALALLGYLLVVLLQRVFKGLMTSQPEVLEIFSFPITQTAQILLLTLGVLLIVLGAFLKDKGIWPELLGLILIAFLSPILARFGGILETTLVGSKGAMALVSFSTLQSITVFPLMFSGMASSLSLVAAGMSMAVKKLSR